MTNNHPHAPIRLGEIPQEIREQLGSIRDIRFPRQGCTSNVAIIDSEQGRFVLKRCRGAKYTGWLQREAFVLSHLSKTALPVPSLRAFAEDRDEQGGIQSWLLMDHLPGEPIRECLEREKDPDKRRSILFEFGKTLRELHSTPCPDELKGDETWLDRMLDQAEYNLRHYRVDGTAELLDWLKTNRPAEIGQALIHGDCTIDNFLVRDGKISAIIDWNGGAFGDPRYDAALAVRPKEGLFEWPEDYDAFFGGYGKRILTGEQYAYFNGIYEFF
jgi:aminoglycoside phosphotransferase (APT) family kinase protein